MSKKGSSAETQHRQDYASLYSRLRNLDLTSPIASHERSSLKADMGRLSPDEGRVAAKHLHCCPSLCPRTLSSPQTAKARRQGGSRNVRHVGPNPSGRMFKLFVAAFATG